MTFKRNISELKSYISQAPEANKSKIKKVIELYENKKIVNFRTALNTTLALASSNKNTSKRAEKEYNQLVAKYDQATPMTGRLKRQAEENKKQSEETKRKNFKEYLLDVLLYVKNPEHEDEIKVNDSAEVRHGKKMAKAYGVRYYGALKQIYAGQVNVNTAEMFSDRLHYDENHGGNLSFWSIIKKHGSINSFLNKYRGRLLTIYDKAKLTLITEDDKRDFEDMSWILMTDPDLKKSYESWGENYICGILIKHINNIDLGDVQSYNHRTAPQRDTTKISRRFNYITTELDLSKDTLKQAIEIDQYVKNECWINTLYDFYGETLLAPDKKRNLITRSMILQIIGKTEETIKAGISIDDLPPFLLSLN